LSVHTTAMVLLRWFWLREIGFSAQTTAMANCDGFLEEANSISFDNISRFAIIYVIMEEAKQHLIRG